MEKILRVAAAAGQLAALLPFAVMFGGLGAGGYVFWHFCVIYSVWSAFCAAGYLCSKAADELKAGGRTAKKARPLVNFASRAAVLLLCAAFAAVCVWRGLDAPPYLYVLPASVVAYFGGYNNVGKSYSDIFSRGWFVLYLVTAVLTAGILWISRDPFDESVFSEGNRILCVGFAVMIVLSAALANQTNIDICTKQRDAGKSALPSGLRRYNVLLIVGICAASVGMFLFAKPLAELLSAGAAAVARGVLRVLEYLGSCIASAPGDELYPSEIGEALPTPEEPSRLADPLFALAVVGSAVALFAFRRQIAEFFKTLFAPLFGNRRGGIETPFSDEFFTSDRKLPLRKSVRKTERGLIRQYRGESVPERKYRLGYALFLLKLRGTSLPPEASDTTAVHREKGERAFNTELAELTEVYDRVRYGDSAPTPEELSRQERLLDELAADLRR